MPRPRFDKLPEERREAILRTAAREFAEHGFRGASLNHILAAAGLSKGAAYYYFDDKADLFATVAGHYFDHVIRDADFAPERLTRRSYWRKMFELSRQTLEHSREWPEMIGAVKALWTMSRSDRESGPFRPIFARIRDLLRVILARGQALGVVRTDLPDDLLLGLVLALDEVGDRWMADHWDELGEAGVATLWDSMLATLGRVLAPLPRRQSAAAGHAPQPLARSRPRGTRSPRSERPSRGGRRRTR
jgi:AcrR family transcriptional regulator